MKWFVAIVRRLNQLTGNWKPVTIAEAVASRTNEAIVHARFFADKPTIRAQWLPECLLAQENVRRE